MGKMKRTFFQYYSMEKTNLSCMAHSLDSGTGDIPSHPICQKPGRTPGFWRIIRSEYAQFLYTGTGVYPVCSR